MSFFYTDDPLADFERWDAEQQDQLKRIPVCADCGHHVADDHYYLINDEVICPECLEDNYRKEIEDDLDY